MNEPDDIALLREFAATKSEMAFAALVSRHINLVHSVALRSTGSLHAAQEISQAVFIILARKANNWPQHAVLSGWLYQTTRLTSANFLRGEIRRQKREQEAYMQSTLNESEPEAWRQIAPLLDDALDKLGDRDRNAIILRFFENKNLRDVGAGLGVNEDAAKMRVTRAVEKLRKLFVKHGVALSAAAIAGAVAANSVQAAPVALTKSMTAVAMMKGVAASGSTFTLTKGTLKIMVWSKIQTAVVASVIILVAAGTTTILGQHERQQLPRAQPVASGETKFPKESWAFAGYDNPESAFRSCMWAANKGDVKMLLAGLSAVSQQRLASKPYDQILTAKDRADYAKMTGYRILDKQVRSENEVLLEIHADGLDQTKKIFMQRVGNEWKLGSESEPESK
jgi:RNA polymerase sigma factor (sigma-70 family)